MTFRLTRPTSWGWQFHCFAWHLVSLTCGLSDYTYRKSERTSNLLLLYFLLFILFLFYSSPRFWFLESLRIFLRPPPPPRSQPQCELGSVCPGAGKVAKWQGPGFHSLCLSPTSEVGLPPTQPQLHQGGAARRKSFNERHHAPPGPNL